MRNNDHSHLLPGVPLALASALLFGASTPFSKLLLSQVDPQILAGLLYLAAGVGLAAVHLGRAVIGLPSVEAPLRRSDLPWLAAVTIFGGLIGPLLLMLGLARTEAATAALLLNLESLATMAIAWLWFHENVDRRLLLGALAIVAGAVIISWEGTGIVLDFGALLVAGACLAWGIDNNVTRKLSSSDPVMIAMIKGLAAGSVNVALAFQRGAAAPPLAFVAGAGIIGFLGIGVSLVLFVLALRHLGTARTGAYFSLAPFIGASTAILLLHDPLTPKLVVSACLMGFGLWMHISERHEHVHVHEVLEHEHSHVHDAHHQHEHDGPSVQPHSHWHRHERLTHAHPHYPDLHHRHLHADRGAISPIGAMLNLRSATFGAAVAVVATVFGLHFSVRSPQEESRKQAESTAREDSSAASQLRGAQLDAGANPELTKTQESPVAPAPSHGETTNPSLGANDAMRPSGGLEAALRAFLRSEPTSTTTVARFNLDQVWFDVGRTSPRQTSHLQLQTVAQILLAFPKATVFIGYAGGLDRSKAASSIVRARLLSVWRELTRMGVDSARLSLKRPHGNSRAAFNPARGPPPQNAPIFLEITRQSLS
jgi:drug/metabolite transporter (DMT)-like permease/outer membrane protein OmpA-like peptidoglycan-associated protein